MYLAVSCNPLKNLPPAYKSPLKEASAYTSPFLPPPTSDHVEPSHTAT